MASRGPFGKGNIQAAREFLAGMPEFTQHSKKGAFGIGERDALRTANAFTKQLQAGVTPNYQAARGHILTPEHGPKGARPKLPEKAENYQRATRTSKEARAASEAPSAPSQRATARLTGEPAAPLIHRRPAYQTPIPFPEGGVIYTVKTEEEARRQIEFARVAGEANGKTEDGDRVVVNVFDCSKNKYFQVFQFAKGSYGIPAGVLLEMAKDHGGLESLLMSIINDNGSAHQGKISHICLYEIVVLPGELPAVKALKQQMGVR